MLEDVLVPGLSQWVKRLLFQGSTRFRTLLKPYITRHTTLILSLQNGVPHVRVARDPDHRVSDESPSLPHQDSFADTESKVTLDMRHYPQRLLPLTLMSTALSRIVSRMDGYQPVRILLIQLGHAESRGCAQLLQLIPTTIRDTIHTLCLNTFYSRNEQSLLAGIGMYQHLTTFKMQHGCVDVSELASKFGNLKSLHLIGCRSITGWDGLAQLSRLVEFSIDYLSVGNCSSGDLPAEALDAIRQLNQLTSARMKWAGTGACAGALVGCTNLQSLDIQCGTPYLATHGLIPSFQASLDALAAACPKLRRLVMMLPRGITVPAPWTSLEELHVEHHTPIPLLPSITRAVLGNWRDDNIHREAQPENLLSLRIPYISLLSAVACRHLKTLIITAAMSRVRLADHVAILTAVARADVWPELEQLFLLHEGDESKRQSTHYSQLLEALADKPVQHVTLQKGTIDSDTIQALSRLQLRTITLIETQLSEADFTALRVATPSVELLELVDINQQSMLGLLCALPLGLQSVSGQTVLVSTMQ